MFDELAQIGRALEHAHARGLRFLWYTPTEYCRLSPLALGLGAKACNAAEYSICVEPDGGVRLCELTPPVGNVRASRFDLHEVLRNGEARQGRRAARSCACTHACFLERGIRSHPLVRARSLLGLPVPRHG